MGNPYTPQAIANYNASPPPDDGSQTSANTVRWATHKTKLADPIKTLSEAINTQTLSAFGKIYGNNFTTKSANFTVGASDIGKFINVDTSGITATLIAVATAGVGFPITIYNGSPGPITIEGNASETITVGGFISQLNFILDSGKTTVLTCNGSVWFAWIADSGPQRKGRGGGQSVVSSTTFVDDNHMTAYDVIGSTTYELDAYLRVFQNGGDFKFRFVFDIVPVSSSLIWSAEDESAVKASNFKQTFHTGAEVITTMTDNDNYGITIKGIFLTDTLTRSIGLQWAQNSAFSSLTSVGGWMKIKRINPT